MATPFPLSFEFFPPKTPAGVRKLAAVRDRLAARGPEYVSVTYGAGGSTREGTLSTVESMVGAGLDVAPHLSMGSDAPETVRTLIDRYRDLGIRRIVALRGDIPSGMGTGRLHYAVELVRLLREHAGDHFHIEVAAYPEIHPDAPSADADLRFFAEKCAAGADSALTQYFYNADAYFEFCDRVSALGVTTPIIPGIMPITNSTGLRRFSRACGAEIPRWLDRRLDSFEEGSPDFLAFGLDVVTSLCERLISGGAPGLHLYTMNQAEAPEALLDRLGR